MTTNLSLTSHRGKVESVLKEIGAAVSSYTDNAVHFRGGLVPFRPDVVLAEGIIEVVAGQLTCTVKLSAANLLFFGLMAFVALCLAFLSGGNVLVVLAVASIACVVALLIAKVHAESWLVTKLAQQGIQADLPSAGRLT